MGKTSQQRAWRLGLKSQKRNSHKPGKTKNLRVLELEQLEGRMVMNAANGVDPFSAVWFETGLHAGNPPDDIGGAGLGVAHWIVQFDESIVRNFAQVTNVTDLLPNAPFHYEVTGGLGRVGEVEIRSFGGNGDAVEAWLRNNPNIVWSTGAHDLKSLDIPKIHSTRPVFGAWKTPLRAALAWWMPTSTPRPLGATAQVRAARSSP